MSGLETGDFPALPVLLVEKVVRLLAVVETHCLGVPLKLQSGVPGGDAA